MNQDNHEDTQQIPNLENTLKIPSGMDADNHENTQPIPTVVNPDNHENTQPIPTVVNPDNHENTQPIPTVINPDNHENTQPIPTVINPDNHENTQQLPTVPRTESAQNIPAIGEKKEEKIVDRDTLKKVEIEYKPLSKFKTFLLILFFICLIAFVIFLPQISSFVERFRSGKLSDADGKITTGRLVCSLKTNTKTLDKNYDLVFDFTDSKLKKTKFTITTRGDITLDATTLDEMAAGCKQLSANVDSVGGVSIHCEYTSGKLIETQSYDLASIDMSALDSAFSESGGNRPEFQLDEDIDYIERTMYASGYSCNREK